MAPRNALANLSFTVDSASDDDLANDAPNTFPTPDSNTENKAPTRKPRGKAAQQAKPVPAIKATTKGRSTARRASGNSVLAVNKATAGVTKKAKSGAGRKALVERNAANGSDTEEVDEFDGEEEAEVAPVPVKPARRGRPKANKTVEVEEIEEPAEATAPAKKTRKTAGKATQQKTATKKSLKRVVEPEPEPFTIPETQAEPEPEPMDIEESIEFDEVPETRPLPPRPSGRQALQQPRIARQTSAGARRAGSASDSERDPALRRKLGEITRKLEAMTTKYDNLKEVASSGKDSNFEKLKRKTDQTIKDQDAVIKALKQQISEMQSRTSDLYSMKKDISRLEKENTRLTTENKRLTESLSSVQNENKTLSTKLAVARSSVPPESKNVPGSAVKPRSTGVVLPGTIEAAKETQLSKQKVDLYSDLTNLVVLGMKRNEDEEDVYDCLQTGRNGTLHFHLAVASGSESYEDTEFVYQPLLNEQRDRELLDLLPDYLTEEICFPRGQAAKFYMKVVDSMSKKIVLEDE